MRKAADHADLIRLIFRLYVRGRVLLQETSLLTETQIEDGTLQELAEKHIQFLADYPDHVVELEFPDEPNPLERFFRFGTDPRGMVKPAIISLRQEGGETDA